MVCDRRLEEMGLAASLSGDHSLFDGAGVARVDPPAMAPGERGVRKQAVRRQREKMTSGSGLSDRGSTFGPLAEVLNCDQKRSAHPSVRARPQKKTGSSAESVGASARLGSGSTRGFSLPPSP